MIKYGNNSKNAWIDSIQDTICKRNPKSIYLYENKPIEETTLDTLDIGVVDGTVSYTPITTDKLRLNFSSAAVTPIGSKNTDIFTDQQQFSNKVAEGGNLVFELPAGFVASSVDFASYGNPSVSGDTYLQGGFHDPDSKTIVEGYVLGQSGTISIPVNDTVFTDTGTQVSTIGRSTNYGEDMVISIPGGYTVTSVDFASFGDPTGSVGNYTTGTYHDSESLAKVQALLLNQSGTVIIPVGTDGIVVPDQTAINDIFSDSSIIATYQLNSNGNDLGNIYNSTTVTNVTYDTGRFTAAASFDGANSEMDTSIAQSALGTASFSFWAFPRSGTGSVFGKRDTTANTGILGFKMDGAGNMEFAIGNGTDFSSSVSTTYTVNSWSHYVGVIGTTNIKVYKDGSLVADVPHTGFVGTGNLFLGTSGISEHFDGMIEQFRVFNRELTLEEVQTLYGEDEGSSVPPTFETNNVEGLTEKLIVEYTITKPYTASLAVTITADQNSELPCVGISEVRVYGKDYVQLSASSEITELTDSITASTYKFAIPGSVEIDLGSVQDVYHVEIVPSTTETGLAAPDNWSVEYMNQETSSWTLARSFTTRSSWEYSKPQTFEMINPSYSSSGQSLTDTVIQRSTASTFTSDGWKKIPSNSISKGYLNEVWYLHNYYSPETAPISNYNNLTKITSHDVLNNSFTAHVFGYLKPTSSGKFLIDTGKYDTFIDGVRVLPAEQLSGVDPSITGTKTGECIYLELDQDKEYRIDMFKYFPHVSYYGYWIGDTGWELDEYSGTNTDISGETGSSAYYSQYSVPVNTGVVTDPTVNVGDGSYEYAVSGGRPYLSNLNLEGSDYTIGVIARSTSNRSQPIMSYLSGYGYGYSGCGSAGVSYNSNLEFYDGNYEYGKYHSWVLTRKSNSAGGEYKLYRDGQIIQSGSSNLQNSGGELRFSEDKYWQYYSNRYYGYYYCNGRRYYGWYYSRGYTEQVADTYSGYMNHIFVYNGIMDEERIRLYARNYGLYKKIADDSIAIDSNRIDMSFGAKTNSSSTGTINLNLLGSLQTGTVIKNLKDFAYTRNIDTILTTNDPQWRPQKIVCSGNEMTMLREDEMLIRQYDLPAGYYTVRMKMNIFGTGTINNYMIKVINHASTDGLDKIVDDGDQVINLMYVSNTRTNDVNDTDGTTKTLYSCTEYTGNNWFDSVGMNLPTYDATWYHNGGPFTMLVAWPDEVSESIGIEKIEIIDRKLSDADLTKIPESANLLAKVPVVCTETNYKDGSISMDAAHHWAFGSTYGSQATPNWFLLRDSELINDDPSLVYGDIVMGSVTPPGGDGDLEFLRGTESGEVDPNLPIHPYFIKLKV